MARQTIFTSLQYHYHHHHYQHHQSTHRLLEAGRHGTFSWDLELHRSQQRDNHAATNAIIGSLAVVVRCTSTNEGRCFAKKRRRRRRRGRKKTRKRRKEERDGRREKELHSNPDERTSASGSQRGKVAHGRKDEGRKGGGEGRGGGESNQTNRRPSRTMNEDT